MLAPLLLFGLSQLEGEQVSYCRAEQTSVAKQEDCHPQQLQVVCAKVVNFFFVENITDYQNFVEPGKW